MNSEHRHRLLLQGLVGDEHAQQFATDVSFNHSIELLARMLPSMIDGFAVASSAAEAQRADAMDRLRRGLGIPDELADLFEEVITIAHERISCYAVSLHPGEPHMAILCAPCPSCGGYDECAPTCSVPYPKVEPEQSWYEWRDGDEAVALVDEERALAWRRQFRPLPSDRALSS